MDGWILQTNLFVVAVSAGAARSAWVPQLYHAIPAASHDDIHVRAELCASDRSIVTAYHGLCVEIRKLYFHYLRNVNQNMKQKC